MSTKAACNRVYGRGRLTCLPRIVHAYDHRGSLPLSYTRLQTPLVDTVVNPGDASLDQRRERY